jgi:hypothetical protein
VEPKLQLNGSALAGEPEISGSLHGGLDTLRAGRPIILYDGTREIEGDIAFAAAFTTKEQVNLCLKHARGLLCVALPPDDALRIGVQRLHSEDSHTGATPFGMPIDLPAWIMQRRRPLARPQYVPRRIVPICANSLLSQVI